MIIDAVIPLLLEHGRDVTSRQIADAAGVAEGTIFRAFGDKDSLIEAAIARFLDPEPLRRALTLIDPELTLEQKVNDILFHLRSRFTGVMGIMSAMGMRERPPGMPDPQQGMRLIASVLESEAPRLRIPPEEAAYIIRMIAFAVSISAFNDTHPLGTTELAAFIVHGIGNGKQ
jgi:AcrR family transcriptional regulator